LNSRYFHVAEFASHDGHPYPEAWTDRLEALCSQLDSIRSTWGGPLLVVSGYRTPAWNAKVGGAARSQHMDGLAADIAPMVKGDLMTACVADLHGRIMRLVGSGQLPLVGGIGYYPGRWVHIDVRPKVQAGHVAQWIGTGVGSEQAA
jgi:uncharacterized protein YcbK (DUF882 family)